MDVVVKPWAQGKTSELIRRCTEHKYSLIVCITHAEARRVFQEARRLGTPIPMPITYDEFFNHSYNSRTVEAFLLDNLDLAMQQLTTVPIEAVSLTSGKEG